MKPRYLRFCLLSIFSLLPLFFMTGCLISDDVRVLQLLNERGFGRKYSGNANEVFYFGIGDSMRMTDKYNPELRGNFRIAMDGTVEFPQLGETYVAGFTAKEIASMLNQRFGHYYKYVDIKVSPARIVSKKIFIHLNVDRNFSRPFRGDQTLYDIIQAVPYNSIDMDLDNVKVIRADPVNPLVMYCDMDAMITSGDSRDNILIKEDDIIYFTPTLIGYLKRFVKMLLSPLTPIVQLVTGAQRLEYTLETFGDERYYYGRGSRYGYY